MSSVSPTLQASSPPAGSHASDATLPNTPSASPLIQSVAIADPSFFDGEDTLGSVNDFIAGLKESIGDVQKTKAFMAGYQFNLKDWGQYFHFDEKRYQRHMLALNEKFSVLLLCWNPGQSSPVHNHCGNLTKCWIRVLKGQLRYVRYRDDEEPLTIVKQYALTPGHAICMEDPNSYHKTENASTSELAISVHVFSPPYTHCIHGHGGKVIPVVNAIPNVCESEDHYKHSLQRTGASIDMNVQDLVQVLRGAIKMNTGTAFHHSEEVIRNVRKILETTRLQASDWQQYQTFETSRYTRNLVGYDENFTVLLLCWDKGQMSPIHDHAGSSCWVKVLQGELQETLYTVGEKDALSIKSCNTYFPGQATYIRDLYGVHRMANPRNDTPTVSLHIYSPPFSSCHIWDDPVRGLKRNVSMRCANSSKFTFAKDVPADLPDYFSKSSENSVLPMAELESWQSIRVANLKSLAGILLHEFQKPELNVDSVREILDSLSFSRKEWEKYVHFSDVKYTRSLLALNEHFSLVLNCWNKKQGTPVHDHGGCDRKCVVRVLEGNLMLTRYGEDEAALSELPLKADEQSVVLEDGSLGLHKMENSEESTSVSLHLYWPPYLDCSGKRDIRHNQEVKVCHIPVSFCSEQSLRSESRDVLSQLKIEIQCRDKVFTSLWGFVNLLKDAFSTSKTPCPDKITRLLEKCNLNEQELIPYCHFDEASYTRNLVAVDPNFVLFLNGWKTGQSSRIHDHGASRSWFKVLNGSFTETIYKSDDFTEVFEFSNHTYAKGEVRYVPDQSIHRCANTSGGNAYTMHIYSPNFSVCNCYDLKTGRKESLLVKKNIV